MDTNNRRVSQKEFNSIQTSVNVATSRLLEQSVLIKKLRKVPLIQKGKKQEQIRAARALLWLEVGQNRDLHEKTYASIIAEAVNRNDHRFFIRLGKILGRKPYSLKSVIENTPKKTVEWFLVHHWAAKRDGLPEFCYLTPDGLVEVVRHRLGDLVTVDAIVKMRQRLGLRAARRPKIKVKSIGDKLTVLNSRV